MTRDANSMAQHNQVQRDYFQAADKTRMLPSDTPYLNRQADEVLKFAGFTPGESVLEVGCGMGRYTLLLAARGVRVEGTDLTPGLLDRLRAFDAGRWNIPLHLADIAAPPPALEGRFDLVVGFFALHHMHDLAACFRGMTRLLRPGGRIVFLEPNAWNPLYYLQILTTPGMTWQGDRGIIDMRRTPVFAAIHGAGLVRPALRRFGFFPPFVRNRTWAGPVEAVLERTPGLGRLLPFQLFRGDAP